MQNENIAGLERIGEAMLALVAVAVVLLTLVSVLAR